MRMPEEAPLAGESTAEAETEGEAPRGRRLTQQEVLEAALALTRRVGLSRLTMVELAKELGVSTMAAYYYVRNKQALLDLVAEAVIARLVPPDSAALDWEDQLRAYALTLWKGMSEYPGVSEHLLAQPLTRTARSRLEHGVELLRSVGFDDRTARLAQTTWRIYVFGLVAAQARQQERGQAPLPSKIPDYVEFGIDTVLAGLRAQLAAQPERSAER